MLPIDPMSHDKQSLFNNTFLQTVKCALIFENIREDNPEMLQAFTVFLKELSRKTQFLKIILVIVQKAKLPQNIQDHFQVV